MYVCMYGNNQQKYIYVCMYGTHGQLWNNQKTTNKQQNEQTANKQQTNQQKVYICMNEFKDNYSLIFQTCMYGNHQQKDMYVCMYVWYPRSIIE